MNTKEKEELNKVLALLRRDIFEMGDVMEKENATSKAFTIALHNQNTLKIAKNMILSIIQHKDSDWQKYDDLKLPRGARIIRNGKVV